VRRRGAAAGQRTAAAQATAQAAKQTLSDIMTGLRYAAKRQELLGSYLADLAAMIFAYPNVMFPFMAAELHAELWHRPAGRPAALRRDRQPHQCPVLARLRRSRLHRGSHPDLCRAARFTRYRTTPKVRSSLPHR
jgi:hypothetical protein